MAVQPLRDAIFTFQKLCPEDERVFNTGRSTHTKQRFLGCTAHLERTIIPIRSLKSTVAEKNLFQSWQIYIKIERKWHTLQYSVI